MLAARNRASFFFCVGGVILRTVFFVLGRDISDFPEDFKKGNMTRWGDICDFVTVEQFGKAEWICEKIHMTI